MASPKKPERHFQITNNNAVDMHVGKRLRLRRTLLGLSQEQLGTELNITFQQVQKYERAANRISASRLWDIAKSLEVPISYFFEGLDADSIEEAGMDADSSARGDLLADKEALELVRSYYAIPENQRRRLFDLARVLSEAA